MALVGHAPSDFGGDLAIKPYFTGKSFSKSLCHGVDIIRDRENIHDPDIDRLVYGMRNIDTGISLCDITDIERGIRTLRTFFSEGSKKKRLPRQPFFCGLFQKPVPADPGRIMA